MVTPRHRIGSSSGNIIPKPPRAPTKPARQGWAAASERIAAAGDDALVMPEFANEGDSELTWPEQFAP